MVNALAAALEVETGRVKVLVSAGSVVIKVQVQSEASGAPALRAVLTSRLETPSAATALLTATCGDACAFVSVLEVVGIFFVTKKDKDSLRLIIDARKPNTHFVDPPGVDFSGH